jgi:membrane-bound lytic murein transglycosylase D
MKRLLPLLLILLLLPACASQRTNVVATDSPEWTVENLPERVVPAPSRLSQKMIRSEKPKFEKPKIPLQQGAGLGGDGLTEALALKNRQGFDGEENIASLLEPEYLRKFDIPIVFNDAVEYYVRYFCTEKRKVFTSWLRRARRYVPMIREILRERGLPEDLIYLAMIESGFNPSAYSPAAACGPWQFIYATGERYGLRVDHWIDERRDPEKSTVAAAKYLKDLFNQFGCWYLAAAGYNAGEKRIERAILKHDTSDWWELTKYNTLPRETREYIPKLIAAAIIAKEPERFGFTNINYESPIRYVARRVPRATPLAVIADAASTDILAIRSLNPELIRGITPPNQAEYEVKLPYPLNKEGFHEKLALALEGKKRVEGVTAYKVKKKDSLAKIMKKYKVSQSDLMLVNSCDQDLRVKAGKVVYLPRFSRPDERLSEVGQETEKAREPKKQVVRVAAKSEAVQATQEVERAGETRNQVLKQSAMAGMGEVVRKKPAGKQTPVAKAGMSPSERTVQVAKKETPKSVPKQAKTFHIVRKGETLTDISEKYGIEVASLKEMNRLKKDQIYPSMRLDLVAHSKSSTKGVKKFHLVKRGETLTDIAEKYGLEIDTLKGLNRLKKDKINTGMKLKVAA